MPTITGTVVPAAAPELFCDVALAERIEHP